MSSKYFAYGDEVESIEVVRSFFSSLILMHKEAFLKDFFESQEDAELVSEIFIQASQLSHFTGDEKWITYFDHDPMDAVVFRNLTYYLKGSGEIWNKSMGADLSAASVTLYERGFLVRIRIYGKKLQWLHLSPRDREVI